MFRRLMNAQQGDAGDGFGSGDIPPTPSDDMRATLDAAFTASETAEKAPEKAAAPSGEPKAGETPQQTAERVRDERGRFAASEGLAKTAADADKLAQGLQTPQAPAEGDAEKAKTEQTARAAAAPQSWKPGAREHWASLPPDVQQEVVRREREVQHFAQQTAQARQVFDTLGRMQQQFAPALQAEGVDVVTATQNLMGMVSRLRFGTPAERAQTIAGLIENYAVDIEALDSVLMKQPVQQQPGQGGQFMDPRVDQLLGAMQQAQFQRVEQVRTHAAGEVNAFGQGRDFFEDVREDMADVLEIASRRGIDMTLEQAYERACSFNPEIARVVAQRQAAAAAQNPNGSTARARLASSSVRSTPATPPAKAGDQPRNLRDELEDSWGAAANRGR